MESLLIVYCYGILGWLITSFFMNGWLLKDMNYKKEIFLSFIWILELIRTIGVLSKLGYLIIQRALNEQIKQSK